MGPVRRVCSRTWGQDLAYRRLDQAVPAGASRRPQHHEQVHERAALEAGLGRTCSKPADGLPDDPANPWSQERAHEGCAVGYVVIGDASTAGGLRLPDKLYRNILADPHVEVILPSRAFSGPPRRCSTRRNGCRCCRSCCGAWRHRRDDGMGNPWSAAPGEIARKCEGMPLVRSGPPASPPDPTTSAAGRDRADSRHRAVGLLLVRRSGGSRK